MTTTFPPPRPFRIKTSEYNTSNLRDLAASLFQAITSICSSGAAIGVLAVNLLNVNTLNASGASIVNLNANSVNFTGATVTNLFITNEVVTNITGTNANFTNLTGGSLNTTNFVVTNETVTNLTGTNIGFSNSLAGNGTVYITGLFNFTGTTVGVQFQPTQINMTATSFSLQPTNGGALTIANNGNSATLNIGTSAGVGNIPVNIGNGAGFGGINSIGSDSRVGPTSGNLFKGETFISGSLAYTSIATTGSGGPLTLGLLTTVAIMTGGGTLTLPTVVGNAGLKYTVINASPVATTVAVTASAGQTFNGTGSSPFTLPGKNAIDLISDGNSSWWFA
jgi:hypothetical protein